MKDWPNMVKTCADISGLNLFWNGVQAYWHFPSLNIYYIFNVVCMLTMCFTRRPTQMIEAVNENDQEWKNNNKLII